VANIRVSLSRDIPLMAIAIDLCLHIHLTIDAQHEDTEAEQDVLPAKAITKDVIGSLL
jgi:hypothetical protein